MYCDVSVLGIDLGDLLVITVHHNKIMFKSSLKCSRSTCTTVECFEGEERKKLYSCGTLELVLIIYG